MSFESFIKDKIIMIFLLLFGIITIEIFLIPYNYATFIKIYVAVIMVMMVFISLLIEYVVKSSYYKKLQRILDELDEKYLITEIIKKADFVEGKILKDMLEQIDKSMVENVNKYKYSRRGI